MTVEINETRALVDGIQLDTECCGESLLGELYKRYVGDYPKFYKMDMISKLGFLGSELLLARERGRQRFVPSDDRAIIMANHSASLYSDKRFEETIAPENYYPSPSLFVYTLPNIVTGEIAIRNRYRGETMFYVLDDESQLDEITMTTLAQSSMTSAIVGWAEVKSKDEYYLKMRIIWKN